MAEQWYESLTNVERLQFLCATMLLGEEQVAEALADNNDINGLFMTIAERVYGADTVTVQ